MFSPSDYNNAVPQFTNGNYANTPLNPLYVEEPDAANYNRGAEPLQTLPAQWWNWLCNKITSKLNKLNVYVKNIFDELAQLLSLVGVTPDATEEEITTGQLKDMFKNRYPQLLYNSFYNNYNSESALQNRTKGVMVAPNDTWDNDTNTLSLTGGFGVIDSYKKVTFSDCNLTLPNDNSIHYIVSDIEGVISIESTLENNVILVGLCHDKEYCLLIDNNSDQCKDNIILKKWFGQNKITQDFVSVLQSYYGTSISSIETKISIGTVGGTTGISGGTFNNCIITIDTVKGVGIYDGTYNNCIITIGTVSNLAGINNGTFNNCIITIDTIMKSGGGGIVFKGIIGGNYNNCTIYINTVSGDIICIDGGNFSNCTITIGTINNGYGTHGATFSNCIINITTIIGGGGIDGNIFINCIITIGTVSNGGVGIFSGDFSNCTITIDSGAIRNNSAVILNLTHIKCPTSTNLSSTGGKLNVLNNAVLHAS